MLEASCASTFRPAPALGSVAFDQLRIVLNRGAMSRLKGPLNSSQRRPPMPSNPR